jgi:collagen type II alpha
MTETERRELIFKAYNKLKTSFEKFKKPNGEKDSPAKTCKDLYAAYPDLESGRKMF